MGLAPVFQIGAPTPKRVAPPANENDVMREQLEYLIGHVTERGVCNCSECGRYLRVRLMLLEIFQEQKRDRTDAV